MPVLGPTKNGPLFWGAGPPIMVGNENPRTPPERSQVDASVAYNNISRDQKVPEIFEFKVDCKMYRLWIHLWIVLRYLLLFVNCSNYQK